MNYRVTELKPSNSDIISTMLWNDQSSTITGTYGGEYIQHLRHSGSWSDPFLIEIKSNSRLIKATIRPMLALFSVQDGEILGQIPTLDIFAYGPSFYEVLDELQEDVDDLIDELDGLSEECLSSHVRTWKYHLAKHFKIW